MTRALFIRYQCTGMDGDMVQRRKWTPTEFTVSGKPGRGEGVTYPALATARLPTVSGNVGRGEVPKAAQHPRGVATASPKTVSGPSILIEQTVAAASRAGLRESVNAGEGSRMHIKPPAKASNATHPVSGSLRVGGEQANNNAAPHNFNTQRN